MSANEAGLIGVGQSVAGLILAIVFFALASRDLRIQVGKLRRLISVLGTALGEGKIATMLRDDHGEIVGILATRGSSDVGIITVTESSRVAVLLENDALVK